MSVHRIVGIETEYGIVDVNNPTANPMLMSAQVVTAYAQAARDNSPVLWDYHSEDPLNDARGFRVDRASAHRSQLTDEEPTVEEAAQWGTVTTQERGPQRPRGEWTMNTVLTNGARFYVDHAHPEYSGPETTTPMDAVLWDRAGDEIALRATRLLAQQPGMPHVALYKNNTDGKGASYGTHENYLVDRSVPFDDIITLLTAHFVTRPIYCGAGRVGLGQNGQRPGFQLSQRADFIEAEVGLETTLRRPIINTRDEPHADAEKYRRLHVIVGDANLMQVSTFLKIGTTAAILSLAENGQVPQSLQDLQLADPVLATTTVSHDTSLQARLTLRDGREMTALEIQQAYLEAVSDAVGPEPDPQTAQLLERWREVLEGLSTDPMSCAAQVEWVAKLRLLDAMRNRDNLQWDSPKLAAMDLQWSDLRSDKGIYRRLEAAGAVETMVSPTDIENAIHHPPTNTRAYFRGECVRRYPQVSTANWDAIVFDLPDSTSLQRVPMPEPHRGTQAHVEALLDSHPDPHALLKALAGGE